MTVETRVPAKINLWLEVIGKREDGYHDLSSLMLPVSVYDRVAIAVGREDGPITLSCDSPEIPQDGRNLAWRAAELFREASGTARAMHIVLEKEIPSGAGLGGGSADAAGVLLALNSCFSEGLPPAILDELALKLGADVPFFLRQKAALATGIGEKLEIVEGAPDYPLLLIKPPVGVPTAWVYQNLKLTRGRPQIILNRFITDPWQFEGLVENDLETVTIPEYPVIAELKGWLRDCGALAASMSGSGPTVFGIFSDMDAALRARSLAQARWPDFWVRAAGAVGAADIHIRRVSVG